MIRDGEARLVRRTTGLALACILCSTLFLDYWGYSREFHGNPDIFMSVVRGQADAPAQYRIAVDWFAYLLERRAHIPLPHGFVLIDLLTGALALWSLLQLLEGEQSAPGTSATMRWLGACCLVALAQYYLFWVTWYQRPETLPSAAFVAVTIWLLSLRPNMGKGAMLGVSAAVLALAALQGFIRADVAFFLHLGVLPVCMGRTGSGFSLPRKLQAATSALALLLSGGIEFYLKHVLYPHAAYPRDTAVFQLLQNLTEYRRAPPFLLYMAPLVWTVALLARRRWTASAPWLALVAGSAMYFALWLVIGKIDEVRIVLPFALALAPLSAWLAAERVATLEDSERERLLSRR